MNETDFTVTGSELRGCTKGRERICLPNTTKQTEATNCICGNHGVSKKKQVSDKTGYIDSSSPTSYT